MIKPIETWTNTFVKLRHRVRRIWQTNEMPTNDYRFSGIEILEERQMLSGTGGDELPTGGSDGSVVNVGGSEREALPPSFTGLGNFANGLSIPGHWKSVLPAGHSWDSANIFTYTPTSEGTYSYTSYTSDADDEVDTDENSIVVSKYTYTVAFSWQDNVYSEVIEGHLSQYIVATDDEGVRDSIFSGQFPAGNFGHINLESDLAYSFEQTYSDSELVGVEVSINESNDTTYDWTSFNYTHLEADPLSTYTSDANYSLHGASHGSSSGHFQATRTESGFNFETNGGGSSRSGIRGAAEPEFITQTYSGTTTVESGNIDTGAEGKRESLTLDGIVKNKFSSSYSFDGSGTISNQTGTNLATGQITKSSSGTTQFVNDLESRFDSKEIMINIAFVSAEGVEGDSDLFLSGSGFQVNLADDDEIRNTQTTEIQSHTIDRNSGDSSFSENWIISHLGDGRINTSPNPNGNPGHKGAHVSSNKEIDMEEDNETYTSILTNNGAGYTLKSIRMENDSKTVGTIIASVANEVSETEPHANDEAGTVVRVGTIESSSVEDLETTGSSKQTVKIKSLQHVTLASGPILLDRSSDDGDSIEGGTDGGDSGNLSDGSDEVDDNLPTPGGSGAADFNDYRSSITVIELQTSDEINNHLILSQTFAIDGTITTVDNSYGNTTTTYKDGSYIDSSEERSHDPTDNPNENLVINQAVSSYSISYNRKEITGEISHGYVNTNLTIVLTPIPETSEESSGDVGDLTAGTLSLGSSQQYDVTTTGSTAETITGDIDGTLSGNGSSAVSHWINSGSGDNLVHKTINTSGNWELSNSSSSASGDRTAITEFLANGGKTITYSGSSSDSLMTTKTITSNSSRGESSGELPEGMPNPHSDGTMTEDEMNWVEGTWMFDLGSYDFNFADDSSDPTTINNERDKFSGSFSFEKSTEEAVVEIKTNTFSGSVYNYTVTLTPKDIEDSSEQGDNELSEPTVTSGHDTTEEINGYRDRYDVSMSGTLSELDLADIQNNTLNSQTQTVKLSQTEGLHPGSEDYWLGRLANDELPEWANRHMVRTGILDTSETTFQLVHSLVLDSQTTTFDENGAVTTTSIEMPDRPTSDNADNPMGGDSTGSLEPPHPMQQFSENTVPFYEAFDAMIGSYGGVAEEIDGILTPGDSGTSGGPVGGGPGSIDGNGGELPAPADSGTPYTLVTDRRTVDHRQQVQELLFMDDISMGQGYFSVTDYKMEPSEGKSYTEQHTGNRIVYRDLTTSRSLDDYLDETETPAPADSPDSSGEGGSSDSTQTVGGDDTSSYPPSSPGSVTGTFQVVADTSKEIDYKWTQTEKIHSVTFAGVRTQTSQTKTAEYTRNKDLSLTNTKSKFETNGDIDFEKTEASARFRDWDVNSNGKAKTSRFTSDTEVTFTSNNKGNGSEVSTQSKSYTKQKNVLEFYPTFSGKKIATADVEGDVHQTTKVIYYIEDPVTNTNFPLSQETVIHIEESASGAPEFELVGNNMFANSSGSMIQFNRIETGHNTINFSMTGQATSPYNGPSIEKTWGSLVYIGDFETYTYGDLGKDVQYFAIATTVGTRLMGAVTLVGGIAEVAGGVALTVSGAGTFFGVVAVVHGIDTIFAGSTQLLGGAETQTLTAQMATADFITGVAFLSGGKMETEAELAGAKSFGDAVDVLVGLADMAVAGVKAVSRLTKAAKAADTATGIRTAGNAANNLDEATRFQRGASDCINGNCFIAGVPVATMRTSVSSGVLLAESPSLWLPEDENQRSALWIVEVVAVGGVILATIGMLQQPIATAKAKRSRVPRAENRDEIALVPSQLAHC